GARLLLTGRDEARLAEVAGRTRGVALSCDLAAAGGAAALARRALSSASGGIAIVVNNAGLGWAGALGEIPAAQATEPATVNLAGAMDLAGQLVPGMIEGGRGGVVFVSSIAGVTGVRGEAVYAATKAGLAAFAESLHYEVRGHGVTVSVIMPAVIDTPFFSRRGRPYARARPAPVPAGRVATAIVS